MRRQNVKPCDVGKGALQKILRVGRIEKNDVKLRAQRGKIAHRIAANDLRAVGKPAERKILPDQLHRIRAPVHKNGGLCAAGERLDAELSRPGEQVEHARILHIELNAVENALLDLIRGRAGLRTFQFVQPASARRTGDHSHFNLLTSKR